jgi:phosphomethylpyrimidine synthase
VPSFSRRGEKGVQGDGREVSTVRTLIEQAQQGGISWQVRAVAQEEGVDETVLSQSVAEGSVVIMQRGSRVVGIGKGLRTKVNVNLGTSTGRACVEDEVAKVRTAEAFGADTISDLSMGGDINAIRAAVLAATPLPVTTVPVYQAVAEKGLQEMSPAGVIAVMRMQAEQGVSSFVVHTVNHAILREVRRKKRILGVVSKGGSITAAFMLTHQCENPFIEHFDEVLSICSEHDAVLSLGNTARSGCICDSRDRAQDEELRQNVELAHRAHENGVQVIIEGAGGHIRFDRIPSSIRRYKRKSPFPLFVAGPLPVDTAVGYDHIAGCAGASIASASGADYLCYITPAEHLGLPDQDAVREGLIAFRIAAHIGDTVKFNDMANDRSIALMRAALDREGQIQCSPDPLRARELAGPDVECSMCGEFCAIKILRSFF